MPIAEHILEKRILNYWTDRILIAEHILNCYRMLIAEYIFWKGEYGITVTDRMLIAEQILWKGECGITVTYRILIEEQIFVCIGKDSFFVKQLVDRW
jgi:hypothetical protein